MSSYVIQASPLTRMFIPKWHAKCLEDPKLLLSPEPFDVRIPRASGSIELTHNKPVLGHTLLPRSKERVSTDDEVAPLVQWLVNEQNSETDIYGIVEVPVGDNVADAIMAMIHEGDDKRRVKTIEEIRKNMAKGIQEARAKADARVMKACGKMYNVVKSTIEEMKKKNLGVYSPSFSEALAVTIMRDTMASRQKTEQQATQMVNNVMSQMEQPA